MLHPNLMPWITCILDQHPDGLSEHELIMYLCQEPYQLFDREQLKDPLALFQLHFVLFHGLYLLRQQGHLEEKYHLEISALKIQKLRYSPGENNLGQVDSLAEYYLDLSQLEKTDKADVDNLLQNFWQRYLSNDQHTDALAVLELEHPADLKTIKQQYRRLANQHHPDKGGDGETFAKINEAKEILNLYYTSND